MKYLIKSTDVYVVNSVAQVEDLHEELINDSRFTLASFSYVTKYIKEKGEVVDEYQLVTAKKIFNDEKAPSTDITISYEVK